MAGEGQNADKLREYLRVLKPEARALLIAELERGAARGDNAPGADLILQELRNAQGGAAQQSDRSPARLFFAPVEPFLIDDAPQFAHDGRLARTTLNPIWEWICRDLAPEQAKAYAGEVAAALAAKDDAKTEAVARAFQDQVVALVGAALTSARSDDKAKRKLSVQIGTPRALEDIYRVASILRARDAIAALSSRLPGSIKNLSDDALQGLKPLLDSTLSQRELFAYVVILVMSRLQYPWQLIRLATKAANTDDAAKVESTAYALAVTIVLQDVERMVRLLSEDIRRGQAMARPMLLKDIHDAARGLRSEMDLSGDTPWARRLAAVRTDVANLVRSEIESTPGRVRRLLRMRPTKDIVPGATLDQTDVEETENLIAFVGACRNYASELAINEMTLRAWSETQNYLETNIQGLIEALRTATGADRTYRESLVEAAIRFCGKVFGQEYAGLLSKAAEVAAAGGERKAAAKA